MMIAAGDRLTLQVERPAVGGRMIARYDGAIVLVAGAIPGERVVARVERVRQRTVFATTVEVLEASPDRVEVDAALACGGHVLAHVAPGRQAALKAEIVVDAFRRQARLAIDVPPVVESPPDGYRTRARAHVRRGRWGFFAEGSHDPCGIAGSRQLSESAAARLDRLCADVAALAPSLSAEITWVESAAGDRAVAMVRCDGQDCGRSVQPFTGLDGAGWVAGDARRPTVLWGDLFVTDRLRAGATAVEVRHHVDSFFQGNRFLLQPLVDDVIRRVDATSVADLYAGVGLFSVRLAADGRRVRAVEGDRQSAADLAVNGRGAAVAVHAQSVEAFVASGGLDGVETAIVDPPRAGLHIEVTRALSGSAMSRVVYVSCDPATLARDVRQFVDAGFSLDDVRVFDLFPRTAHVEAVVTLRR